MHVSPIQMDASPALASLKWPGNQHILMLTLHMNRQIDKIDVLKLIALRLYLFIISLLAVKHIHVLSDIVDICRNLFYSLSSHKIE